MQNLKIYETRHISGDTKIGKQINKRNIIRIEQRASNEGIIILNMLRNGPSSKIMGILDECHSEILMEGKGKVRIEVTYY